MRKAAPADVRLIREMAQIAFRDAYKAILSLEQIDYMMEWMYSEESLRNQMERDGHIFFIEEGKGYVSFRPDGVTDTGLPLFHLEKLYVLPDCKGKGTGREMFSGVMEEMAGQAAGHFAVELNVNRYNPAVGFYEHLGMKRARSGDFEIGNGFYMNDYIMYIEK